MRYIAIALMLLVPGIGYSQVTFARGDNVLELSGVLNSYFSMLKAPDGGTSYTFRLRDARLMLRGEHMPKFKYQFMIDFAEVNSESRLDYFIVDAYVNIDLPSGTDAYVGFQRLPISRNSNVSTFVSVFSRRPPISDGALYYRRGMGAMIHKKFVYNRLNLYAGAYSNSGALRNFEDETLRLAYVGRVDFAFPGRSRFEEVDIRHSPIPVFGIGLNFLNTRHKSELREEMFPLQIQGRKNVGAIDLGIMYQGFSFQFEITQAWLKRDDDADAELARDFMSNGLHASINYYFKSFKSLFAFRFELFNPDDSIFSDEFTVLTFGYNFLVDQSHDIVIRADYRFFIGGDLTETTYNDEELNIGLQFRF